MRIVLFAMLLGAGLSYGLFQLVHSPPDNEKGYPMTQIMEKDKLIVDILEGR